VIISTASKDIIIITVKQYYDNNKSKSKHIRHKPEPEAVPLVLSKIENEILTK